MEINKKQMEQLVDGFYLFTTPNCPTCEKLKTVLNGIEIEVTISELNAYEHQEIAMKLGLMGTPCLIDYRDNKEYDRMYGAPSEVRISAFLKGE